MIEFVANTNAYLYYTAGMPLSKAVIEFIKEVLK